MSRRRTVDIKIKKFDRSAVLPAYAHPGDACADITALSVEYDVKSDSYIYHTGITGQTAGGRVALGFPRSGIYKTQYFQTNAVGVIDTDEYTGEWLFIFKHRDCITGRLMDTALMDYMNAVDHIQTLPWYKRLFTPLPNFNRLYESRRTEFLKDPLLYAPYKPGDRISQIMILDLPQVNQTVTTRLRKTARGANGHGSTGLKNN